jgi:hypothetical protein
MRIKIERMEVVVPRVEQQAQALNTAKTVRQTLERRLEGTGAGGAKKDK